jgi:hypothetical protein
VKASDFNRVSDLLTRKRIAGKQHLSLSKALYQDDKSPVPIRLPAENGNDLYVRPDTFVAFLRSELDHIEVTLKELGVDSSES